jgi:PAS domain S-box-containing protein
VQDDKKTKEQLVEELKELREQLATAKRGEQILNALMKYIPEGITIADTPDVRIRMVSEYGQQLTGRSNGTIVGIPVEEHSEKWGLFHADGVTSARTEDLPLTRATQKGEVVTDEEMVLVRPDGTKITILCNAGPIQDSEGNITGGLIAWRDITEIKHGVERIESIAKFPEENPNPVLRVAEDGRLLYANRSSSILLESQGWEVGGKLPDHWRATILGALSTDQGQEVEVDCGKITYSLVLTPVADSKYVNL